MQHLVKQQKADALKIQKIHTNYKKDPSSRKTKQYLESRLANLNCLWEGFEKRNNEIEQHRSTNPQEPYFVNEFFAEVEAMYEEVRDTLEDALTDLIQKSKSTEAIQEQLKAIRKQNAIIESLKRAISSIENDTKTQVSTAYCIQKMKLINEYWEHILSNHSEIMAMGITKSEYLDNNVFSATEDAYQKTIIKLQEHLCKSEPNESKGKSDVISIENGMTQKKQVKLPRIDIPAFNGDYLKWQSFRDLFTELIYKEQNMSGAQKLFYLKSNLIGEPNELIQHLSITNDNFEAAWAILEKRYNNKRTLLAAQLRTLLKQATLTKESSEGLKKLHDTTIECLEGIKNLGINTENWDPLIIHLLIEKLDKESHRLYEQSLTSPREIQKLEDFLEFLENRFQGLEALEPTKAIATELRKSERNLKSTKVYLGTVTKQCSICGKDHRIYSCETFNKFNIQQKINATKKANLCQNCLIKGHNTSNCKSWKTCKICGKKHHTLLHYSNSKPTIQKNSNQSSNFTERVKRDEEGQQSTATTSITTHLAKKYNGFEVLLATALIRVIDKSGNAIQLRALLDQGSQATFISDDAVQRLRLPRRKTHAIISGVGCSSAGITKSSVEITLTPRFHSTFSTTTKALVLKNLTRYLPTNKIISGDWKHTENLVLADPTFATPGKIDIILGAEVFGKIILPNMLRGPEGTPLVQQTELGWILSGEIRNMNKNSEITCMVSDVDISNELQKFWECEDLQCERVTTTDDIACENHYRLTHRREDDGSYVVRIPFRENPDKVQLDGSRELALARLFQMERKFKYNKVFETMYKDFMKEYQQLGHMVLANDNIEKKNTIYHTMLC